MLFADLGFGSSAGFRQDVGFRGSGFEVRPEILSPKPKPHKGASWVAQGTARVVSKFLQYGTRGR